MADESLTARRVRVGVDTGGTFTDVVAVDDETGEVFTAKTASTPSDPAVGFLAGIDKVLSRLALGPDAVAGVCHGTTVATNKLLEGKVAGLGFITTEGYAHLLEIARQSVPDGYGNSYFWVKPARIVPVHRVRAVGGRLAVDGSEIRPFDEAGAVAAAESLRASGVMSVGVCFLHSYANPAHELAMLDVLERVHPAAFVSLSSQVLREYREYERAVTTLVDAAVKPDITGYVASVSRRLETYGSQGQLPFYVMKSNGGVLAADEVVHQPITTVLSGPAAGALGAAELAGMAGFDRVLTCDGGGTSTDVAVVVDGRPALTTEGTIGAYPSKIAMIDVVTVGAGGGSIAWTSPEGTLKVGPQSAGADPGPMCYGAGGDAPTVTDAHVVLGRLPPHLLGGEIALDVARAHAGIEELSGRLGLAPEATAAGILEISAWNQANALRQITVKRGVDVRDFQLVTFGGSGSLLACRLMDILGLRGVLVPLNAGNLSAYGLLTVDVRNDYVRTAVTRHSKVDAAAFGAIVGELAAEAEAALQRQGFPAGEGRLTGSADLRYFGQAYEVRVDLPGTEFSGRVLEQAASAFHDEHQRLYGYDFRDDARQEVEWVNLRVTGVGPIRKPRLRRLESSAAAGPVPRTRDVRFDDWTSATVYDRRHLVPGGRVDGPAVIEEESSTLPLHPGFMARVDAFGNLLVSRTEDLSR